MSISLIRSRAIIEDRQVRGAQEAAGRLQTFLHVHKFVEEVIGPWRGLAVGRGRRISAAHGDGGMVPARESDDEIGIEPSADPDDLDLLSAERVMGMGDGDESRRGLG